MVAMNVWPTDAADGSVANEDRWRKMARHWAPSGVAYGVGGELAPSLTMPNLTVAPGACWVDGHYCELTGSQVLTATANGLAVVRFDPVANTAELLWRDAVSTPTQNPTGTWELPIAQTVSSVLADLRVNSLTASQTTPRFANAAARAAKIPRPVLNQTSWLDTAPGVEQYWNGSTWTNVVPAPPVYPVWPIAAGYAIQYGSVVMTTDANGNCGFAYGYAYAGTGSVVVCTEAGGLGANVGLNNANNAIVGTNLQGPGGGPVANGLVRVDWIAVGIHP
jgi:hypothetical protein